MIYPDDYVNKILQGDCLELMKGIPENSVDCCITSPPYWGLRDYGVEGQFGLEKIPEEYAANMVKVFGEVKRVLKKDGTLWLNLGDSYFSQQNSNRNGVSGSLGGGARGGGEYRTQVRESDTLKQKDLCGIPWRVAFALQSDGWYLRQDIIWHKPNPMPESVIDRCTKAHEYIFLLAKSQKYYFDNEAIKEPSVDDESYEGRRFRGRKSIYEAGAYPVGVKGQTFDAGNNELLGKKYELRNRRSVWTITTKPFKGAHFATFPEDLILPCVLAGCPKGGIILDPFSGAGTTALVAKKQGRKYIGLELNPEYCEITRKRVDVIPERLL